MLLPDQYHLVPDPGHRLPGMVRTGGEPYQFAPNAIGLAEKTAPIILVRSPWVGLVGDPPAKGIGKLCRLCGEPGGSPGPLIYRLGHL